MYYHDGIIFIMKTTGSSAYKSPVVNHRWLTPSVRKFSENIYKVTASQNYYGYAIILIKDILYDVPIKKLV